VLQAQTEKYALTLQEASEQMMNNNPTVLMANKAIDMARGERQKLNAFWYPMLNTSGMVIHLSNRVEVKQPLDTYTEPAIEFVQSIFPNDQLISSILDQVGSYTLSVPILQRNLTTLDANLTWPVFTGGKRLYASQIGKRMVDIAEVGKEETRALLHLQRSPNVESIVLDKRASKCSIIENIPPKGVSFSDFILIFAILS
jgi:outer membrane protein TolC